MSTLQCCFDQSIQMPIYDQYPQLSNDDNTSLVHLIMSTQESSKKYRGDKNTTCEYSSRGTYDKKLYKFNSKLLNGTDGLLTNTRWNMKENRQ